MLKSNLDNFFTTAGEGLLVAGTAPFWLIWLVVACVFWPIGWLKIKLMGPRKPVSYRGEA